MSAHGADVLRVSSVIPPPAAITNAAGVRKLSGDEAAKGIPVALEGVITFANEEMNLVFLQDDSGSVYVDAGPEIRAYRSGQAVQLTGRSARGRFSPIVTQSSMVAIGRGTFPQPRQKTLSELWIGNDDCNWVTARIFVTSHKTVGPLTILNVVDANASAEACVDGLPENRLSELDFSELEISGPASIDINDNRRISKVSIWVPGPNQVRVLRTASDVLADVPDRTLAEIAAPNASLNFGQPVRVRGTAVHNSPRFGLKLQDGNAGLTVILKKNQTSPPVGQKVEATGWLRPFDERVRLRDATLHDLGPGTLPIPTHVTLPDANIRSHFGTVVTLEGILRHRVIDEGDPFWILENNGEYFEAFLPPGTKDSRDPGIVAGTTLKVTGVLVGYSASGQKRSPAVLLRTPADMEVTSAAPWPIHRVLQTLLILVGLHAVGLVALAWMYSRLRNRTADLNGARLALEVSNRDLERRVESRTRTLSTAHEALRESEERFRQLVGHIDQIFWMCTADHQQVLYLSPGFEKICGWPAESLYRDPDSWIELVHPDDRERVRQTALVTPVAADYEMDYRIVRRDGSIRWIRDRAFPIKDPNGTTCRLAGIAEDITERRQAEEELREQHIALTHAMPGIARLDASGHYVTVNSHYARLLGYGENELATLPCFASVHPKDIVTAMRAFEQMRSTGMSEAEFRSLRKDGSTFWAHVLLVRIEGAHGDLAGHRCFMRDITNRKQNEQLLEGQKAVLETIASGAPLSETLCAIARFIETHAAGLRASICITSEDGKRLGPGASPSLPEEFARAIADLEIGPNSGACGAAAHTRQRVTIVDLAADPKTAAFKELAAASGLRACSSTPIFASDGPVVGTLAIYFAETRGPTPEEEHLTHLATQLAAIAIEQQRILRAELDAQDRYRAVIASAIDAVITLNENQRIQIFNPAAERMFGRTENEAREKLLEEFIPERQRSLLREYLHRVSLGDGLLGTSVPINGLRHDGGEFPIEASLSQTKLHGKIVITAILRDSSEKEKGEQLRSQLESRLRQAQKMEAIGTLAGGIAHDFNNILGAIMLNIELARSDLPDEHPSQEYLNALRGSSIRARDLVRQILTFSRQQEPQRSIVRLERIIGDTLKLIRAALPSSIEINLHLSSNGPSIIADPTQLHQIITNLCTNAGHAMRDRGGRLEIVQRHVTVDPAFAAASPDLQPGSYVVLSVSDTGSGMAPEVAERIFDPFFTTKPLGEGTGLGLAVVHGIMKDHDGAILLV